MLPILFNLESLAQYIEENKYPQTTWHILTMLLFTEGKWKNPSRHPKSEKLKCSIDI